MSFTRDSKQKLTTVAFLVIIGLLGVNAYLLYNKVSLEKENTAKTAEIEKAEDLRKELDKNYNETLQELEDMIGNNEELNGLIDKQKVELTSRKNKINRLIGSGKATKADLAEARTQIDQFKIQLDQYLAENNTLKEEKAMLTQKTAKLTADKQNLQGQISQERTMNNELVTAKAALVSEKQMLESQNQNLSTKVTRASVVNVAKLNVKGERIKKSGKVITAKKAKNVDRLKVCFNAEPNEVTEKGIERFFVRVITPVGETMAVENMGSGIMRSADGTNQIRYTQMKEIDYDRSATEACFYWEPGRDFPKGNYEVEVYNKGYIAGRSTFKLK